MTAPVRPDADAPPLLAMRGILKRFPGVLALAGVDLEVRAGEVHCLLGQNGAGKSTLIKILSGSYQPDEGEISWSGQPVSLPTPIAAIRLGISTIYQELDLVPDLTVTENIFLGHELSTAGFTARRRAARRAAELLHRLGHGQIPVDRLVGDLAPAAQQIVSLARALSHDTRLLILDEPSAVLDQEEVRNLPRDRARPPVRRGLVAARPPDRLRAQLHPPVRGSGGGHRRRPRPAARLRRRPADPAGALGRRAELGRPLLAPHRRLTYFRTPTKGLHP